MISDDNSLTYTKTGIDINATEALKRDFAKSMETKNDRVLNRVGAFASLFDIHFPDIKHPVLVFKTEEPGSKQKLAFRYNRIESICYDMINHLVNDIIVMGATPLAVQDAIICGGIDKDTILQIVSGISKACIEQGCVLTGGETSIQPGVVEAGLYILTSSIVGIVEKNAIIDGSRIEEGDIVLALASNGLHTNGYTLVRALMDKNPEILKMQIDDDGGGGGSNFLDVILTPHMCYYHLIKDLFAMPELHGMAHITGGGIEGNLNRILPQHRYLDALINGDRIRIPAIFKFIKEHGNVPEADMRRTFNNGVGLAMVVHPSAVDKITAHIAAMRGGGGSSSGSSSGCDCYEIGKIIKGNGNVVYEGNLSWKRG